MITSIRLQHFRSYRDESFEFDPGVNIVVGPNASGKTNLLEAVMVLGRGRSYKAKDMELLKFGGEWARLDGFFDKQNRSVKLQQVVDKIDKTFLINDKPYRRLNLERSIPLVFFEPNHLQLISRGPESRRDYIDDLLERSLPAFKPLASNYRRTLAQRNALLKHNPVSAQRQLFAWNVRLSELGGKIAQARQALVDDINSSISKTYSKIAHKKSSVELNYKAQFPTDRYASRLLSKLENSSAQDFQAGLYNLGASPRGHRIPAKQPPSRPNRFEGRSPQPDAGAQNV